MNTIGFNAVMLDSCLPEDGQVGANLGFMDEALSSPHPAPLRSSFSILGYHLDWEVLPRG